MAVKGKANIDNLENAEYKNDDGHGDAIYLKDPKYAAKLDHIRKIRKELFGVSQKRPQAMRDAIDLALIAVKKQLAASNLDKDIVHS